MGAGSWGTAISELLAKSGYDVNLWARREEQCMEINSERTNGRYLPGVRISRKIKALSSIEDVVSTKKIIFVVVPSQHMRDVLKRALPYIEKDTIIISAVKGIENSTLMRPTQIIQNVLGRHVTVAVLSGPSFAKEVVLGLPTAVTISARDISIARQLQHLINVDTFRLYASDDVIGVELGGCLKNVIALSAGVCDGVGLGKNARAAIITRGLAEMIRLGVRAGAKKETFSGLSGIGDLVLTSTDDQSRNRTVGLRIGRGEKIDDIVRGMTMVAEGVKTSISVRALAKRYNVDMPVSEEIYRILNQGKEPKASIKSLLGRTLKDEHYE